ncbi:MAG TPA: hypothetical protein VIU12_10670 [Chryseolinea sp.]
MKRIFLLLTLTLLGCGSPKEKEAIDEDTVATAEEFLSSDGYVMVAVDSLKTAIDAEAQRQVQTLGSDPRKYNAYLTQLSPNDPASIPYAILCLKKYPAPTGSPVYDTLYRQFANLYFQTAGHLTDTLNSKEYTGLLDKLYDHAEDPDLRNFLNYLDLFSLKVFITEGTYYADADPDLFYSIFRVKASPPLLDYLEIRKKELKEGFSEDAGLVISFPEVYERVESWGKFMADYPDHSLRNDALNLYEMYLSTLITGMDNSRVFDFEKERLDPEIKSLYENIMKAGKDSLSRKIITDYYILLSKNDFKYNESVNTFLDKYQLSTMLAVEPPTR